MKVFWGKDFGIIALAKSCLEDDIHIIISSKIPRNFADKNYFSESDLWLLAVKNITEEKTKFGRIGILFDRKNKEAESFYQTLAKQKFSYQQRNIRAQKSAKSSIIQTQILREMANEGLADSVEFRRILRKYIRNAKDLHLDSLLFLEGIFAEKRTRQIIAKTAGTQIETYFLSDFLNLKSGLKGSGHKSSPDLKDLNSAKKVFSIKTDEDLKFAKKRAEQILQRKLKNADIVGLE